MSILRGDAEISSSRNIDIYIIIFEQNCNNLKMAAIGRNMQLLFAIKCHHKSILP